MFLFFRKVSHARCAGSTHASGVRTISNDRPAGILRYEKDVFGGVLINILLEAIPLGDQLIVLCLKAV